MGIVYEWVYPAILCVCVNLLWKTNDEELLQIKRDNRIMTAKCNTDWILSQRGNYPKGYGWVIGKIGCAQ